MKLIMAVSADGFVARMGEDDMRWTGSLDKAVFRLLTGVGTEPLAVGRRTRALMPSYLPGREIYVLSSSGGILADGTLANYHDRYPDGWLIGGQTVAVEAREQDLLSEVHLCRSTRFIWDGVPMSPVLTAGMTLRMSTLVVDLNVEVYR